MTTKNPDSERQTGPSFSEFPIPSYESWRSEVERVLKGAPFEKRMVTKTYEGIDLEPIYQESHVKDVAHLGSLPGFPPYVRSTDTLGYKSRLWDVAQEIRYGTAKEFNAALQSDLERGQNAVNLALDRATRFGRDADSAETDDVGKGGTSLSTVADLAEALDKINLEEAPIFVSAGATAVPFMALVAAYLRQNVKSLENLRGCIGADPTGTLVREGTLAVSTTDALDAMANLTAWAKTHAPKLQTVFVQGHPYHDAGASATQELGFVLATAVEYIRELQSRGLAIDDIAPRVRLSLSLGSNFFMEIAKLRATRLLWAKIVKAFGGNEESQKACIHTRTSQWNKTFHDPYVNMLRTTTEAFSGVAGGCDSMHIGPFDEALREPDEFSRRIARNTHIILSEECNVPRTIDPAGGSWYVESLTDAVARESWAILQAVEKAGGMLASLRAGDPQKQVADVAARRAKAAAARKDVFVGTNMYANMTEKPLAARGVDHAKLQSERAAALAQHRQSIDTDWRQSALEKLANAPSDKVVEAAIHAADGGATIGEISAAVRGGDGADTAEPVRIHRGAEHFEALRQAVEAYAARTGGRPKAFLANMGPLAQHKARADFSRAFLEVGAFDVIGSDGFADPASAAKAAIDSGAPVIVVCSTDPTYPELVPPLAKHIKESHPGIMVLLAGYPADHVEAFKAAGVDDFIHLRANCYELLSNLQKKIGVQQ